MPMTRAVPSGHRACLADPAQAPPAAATTGLGDNYEGTVEDITERALAQQALAATCSLARVFGICTASCPRP